jgi:competence protein ComEC
MRRERVLLLLLLAAVIAVWFQLWRAHARTLTVTVLDVGQGDSLLVRSPTGRAMLIDGGGRAGQDTGPQTIAERVILPALALRGVGRLDVILLTHPHDDHVGGLAQVVEQIPTRLVLDPELEHPSPSYRRFREAVAERKVRLVRARAGQKLNLGAGASAVLLHPSEPLLEDTGSDLNNNSVVLRVSYGRRSFLLMGDAEEAAEQRLLERDADLRCDVLKVGHHGSSSGTTERFLRAARPRWAAISVGARNPFGHPDEEVLSRLRSLGIRVLRTDREGAVTFSTDGRRLRVRTFASLR